MEVQRGRVTCTMSHSKLGGELEIEPSSLDALRPAGRISERQGIPPRPASILQQEDSSLHLPRRKPSKSFLLF